MAISDETLWLFLNRGITPPTNVQNLVKNILVPSIYHQITSIFGIPFAPTTITEYVPFQQQDFGHISQGIDSISDRPRQSISPTVPRLGTDNMLQLSRGPVISVTSVHENAQAWLSGGSVGDWPDANLVSPSDYRLDITYPGSSQIARLVRVRGIWINQPKCIRVIYSAGLPSDLTANFAAVQHAVLVTAAHYLAGNKAVLNAITSGGFRTGRSMRDVSEQIQALGGGSSIAIGGVSMLNSVGIPDEALKILSSVLTPNMSTYL